MVWLIIILVILIAICAWILFSPLILIADTRIPAAEIRWKNIGSARIWFEQEWWLRFRIFFFTKKMRIAGMKSKKKRITSSRKKKPRKRKPKAILQKIIRVLRSLQVTEWQLAIDTGDYAQNAKLFPLNFAPYAKGHTNINFMDENYLDIKIKGVPWKMFFAYMK